MVQLESPLTRGSRPLDGNTTVPASVEIQNDVGIGQPRIGWCVLRIEVDCLLKVLDASLHRRLGTHLPKEPALLVGNPSAGISGAFGCSLHSRVLVRACGFGWPPTPRREDQCGNRCGGQNYRCMGAAYPRLPVQRLSA